MTDERRFSGAGVSKKPFARAFSVAEVREEEPTAIKGRPSGSGGQLPAFGRAQTLAFPREHQGASRQSRSGSGIVIKSGRSGSAVGRSNSGIHLSSDTREQLLEQLHSSATLGGPSSGGGGNVNHHPSGAGGASGAGGGTSALQLPGSSDGGGSGLGIPRVSTMDRRKSFLAPTPGAGLPGLSGIEGAMQELVLAANEQRINEQINLDEDGMQEFQDALQWTKYKLYLWLFLEEPFVSPSASTVSIMIVALIALSLGMAAGEQEYGANHNNPYGSIITKSQTNGDGVDKDDDHRLYLNYTVFDGSSSAYARFVIVIFFTMEAALRFAIAPKRKKFFTQPNNIADMLAILPYWCNNVFKLHEHISVYFHVLSIFSSFFWVLKLTRYFSGWFLLSRALRDAGRALTVPVFFLMIVVMCGSSLLLLFEKAHAADEFGNLMSSGAPIGESKCAWLYFPGGISGLGEPVSVSPSTTSATSSSPSGSGAVSAMSSLSTATASAATALLSTTNHTTIEDFCSGVAGGSSSSSRRGLRPSESVSAGSLVPWVSPLTSPATSSTWDRNQMSRESRADEVRDEQLHRLTQVVSHSHQQHSPARRRLQVDEAEEEAEQALDACVTIDSLFKAIHYTIVAVVSIQITEVYGKDVASNAGRVWSVIMMFLGVIFLSMPIAIVGTSFSQTWFEQDTIILVEKVRSRMRQQGYTTNDLREVFNELDEDGSGCIEFHEFKRMLEAFHFFGSLATCRKLFNHFDCNGTGSISYQEFVCGIFPEIIDVDELDGSYEGSEEGAGFLDANELDEEEEDDDSGWSQGSDDDDEEESDSDNSGGNENGGVRGGRAGGKNDDSSSGLMSSGASDREGGEGTSKKASAATGTSSLKPKSTDGGSRKKKNKWDKVREKQMTTKAAGALAGARFSIMVHKTPSATNAEIETLQSGEQRAAEGGVPTAGSTSPFSASTNNDGVLGPSGGGVSAGAAGASGGLSGGTQLQLAAASSSGTTHSEIQNANHQSAAGSKLGAGGGGMRFKRSSTSGNLDIGRGGESDFGSNSPRNTKLQSLGYGSGSQHGGGLAGSGEHHGGAAAVIGGNQMNFNSARAPALGGGPYGGAPSSATSSSGGATAAGVPLGGGYNFNFGAGVGMNTNMNVVTTKLQNKVLSLETKCRTIEDDMKKILRGLQEIKKANLVPATQLAQQVAALTSPTPSNGSNRSGGG